MRIALVSPYSWTYPGGVTRHIEALAGQFLATGHDVRVLAPYDPSDRLAERLHRGATPEPREAPDYLIPLGRTVGFPANGAVSNLAITPYAVSTMRRELAAGGFDVINVHEPVAPYIGWDVLSNTSAPLVGTFHCYSTKFLTNGTAGTLLGARWRLNRLTERIAVSEAAAWTGRRFYGGRYRIIPNGVQVPEDPTALHTGHATDPALHVVFVGQAVERKGLPVLLRAFEALREHVPARLTIVGAGHEDVAPILLDARGVTALGKVDDETKTRGAAQRRRPRRSVAGRGELRHGAHGGVRRRHAGRRVRHRRLPGRRAPRRRRPARPARRRRRDGRRVARAGPGPRAPSPHGCGRGRARTALQLVTRGRRCPRDLRGGDSTA